MRVVIVGAGYAGLTCALRLSRSAPESTEVTLVNASPLFVERIRLHEQAAGRPQPTFALASFLRGTRVQLYVGNVEQIDLGARSLRVDQQQLGWDRLVLALGSRVTQDQVPGVRDNAFTLDATSTGWLSQVVPSVAARTGTITVIGGGLTGIEAATELAEAYPSLRVTLVTRAVLAGDLPSRAQAHLRRSLARLSIRVREHVDVRAVEPRALSTRDGVIPFDACVWSAGFEAPSLARALGLPVNANGQIWCDAKLRAIGREDVYVAGDLLALREPRGVPLPMGCKSAFPTGMHVADNIARALRGVSERDYVHRAVFYCVSLGRHDGILLSPSAHTRDARPLLMGRAAARVKELICRGTRWALTLEQKRARLAVRPRLVRSRGLPALASDARHEVRAPAGP